MKEDIIGKEFPDFENDYHGHPDYLKTYLMLMAFFVISITVGYFTTPMVAVALIFFTAIIKTALVVRYFMHLKYEPMLVWIFFLAVLFIIIAFYYGVFIDVTGVKLELAK